MNIDPRLLHDIKFAEAPGGKACLIGYADGGGVPTAGYGHTGPDVAIGAVYTQEQCDDWLDDDVAEAAIGAQRSPEWQFLDTPCRCNAVVECIFNLGDTHWLTEFPGTRAAIRRQDWQSAHDNLLKSPLWIKEVGIDRVKRLAQYLLWGAYP